MSADRPNRIHIVSYPKCGRTWLRLMIGRALSQHLGIVVDNLMDLAAMARSWPGLPVLEFSHDGPANRLSKTELLADDRSRYAGESVVLLVRNPADVVVSYYFEYTRRRTVFSPGRFDAFDGGLSEFIRLERGGIDSILGFYTSWAQCTAVPESFLLLRYEDLHADPAAELRRLFQFIGVPVSADAITDAVYFARFDNMRRLELADAFGSMRLRPGDPGDTESFKTRRGKVGGFADYLSDTDISYIHERFAALPPAFRYQIMGRNS